jgi:phospholipid transport system substrate-binding protein
MKDVDFSRISRRSFASLLFALSMVPAGAAKTPLSPAEEYVTRIADDVMRLANSGQKGAVLRGKFAALLERYVNLRSIANFSLGPYQKLLPPEKKEEFYRLVSNYSAALFVYYVEDFRGSELEITSTTQQGKFTTIMSAIKLKDGGREQVRWRLVSAGDGYRVSDVNLKGIWLTISMKKRFGDTLKRSKGDFGPLFAELREAETW